MELDDERGKLDNDADLQNQGFVDQTPLSNEKIKNVLAAIAKLGENDKFKKAELIDRSAAVKELLKKFDKDQIKPAELNKLRKIFYDEYDQDREDFLYDDFLNKIKLENAKKGLKKKTQEMAKEARKLATIQVLNDDRKWVIKILKDQSLKSKVAEVKEEIKKDSENAMKEDNINKINEPKIDLEAIQKVEEAALKIEWDNDLEGDKYLKEHEEEYAQRRSKIIEGIKKKKQDKFLKAFNVYEKVATCHKDLLKSVNVLNTKSNDHSFAKANDSSAKDWDDLGKKVLKDVEFALKEYVKTCTAKINTKDNSCDNAGAYIQLGAIGIAMFNRIQNLETTVNCLTKTITALMDQINTMSQLSQQEVIKVNKRTAQKLSGAKNFINNEDWLKLSAFQKFQKSFVFRDMVQNPPRAWWKTFDENQKMEVLKKKIDWQRKRLVELAEMHSNKGEDVAARFIDSFFYYENRDKFGYELDFTGVKNPPSLDEDSKLIYDELKENLNNLSEKNLVFNRVAYNNSLIRTKGHSSLKKIEEIVKFKNEKKNKRNTKRPPNPNWRYFPYDDYNLYDDNQDYYGNYYNRPGGFRRPYKKRGKNNNYVNNKLLNNKRNPPNNGNQNYVYPNNGGIPLDSGNSSGNNQGNFQN